MLHNLLPDVIVGIARPFFVKAMKTNKLRKTISFVGSGDDVVERLNVLSCSLKKHCSIQEIYFENNSRLGEPEGGCSGDDFLEGFGRFTDVLQGNTLLKKLHLSANGIGDEVKSAFKCIEG